MLRKPQRQRMYRISAALMWTFPSLFYMFLTHVQLTFWHQTQYLMLQDYLANFNTSFFSSVICLQMLQENDHFTSGCSVLLRHCFPLKKKNNLKNFVCLAALINQSLVKSCKKWLGIKYSTYKSSQFLTSFYYVVWWQTLGSICWERFKYEKMST